MDSVTQWAMTVSVCAAVVCIVEMLLSDTALEKTVRLVLGVFMLSAILLPVGNMVKELTDELPSAEQTDVSDIPIMLSGQRKAYLQQQLCELIDKTLSEQDISAAKIIVDTDIADDGSISMITAEISLHRGDAQKSAKVSRIVKDELGISCRTIIIE